MTDDVLAYTALVTGSTGAVGREIVAQLVDSPKCQCVVAVTRRVISEEELHAAFPSLNIDLAKGKLEVRPVDFTQLNDSLVSGKVDAVFHCLGSTRSMSVETFRQVDLEHTVRIAEITKNADIPYFGLLSSAGANAKSWFLYPQTKGEAEEQIKKLEFGRLSIFQPGLLDRGNLARRVEKIAKFVLPSISAASVAKSMIADYENEGKNKGLKVWSNAQIHAGS